MSEEEYIAAKYKSKEDSITACIWLAKAMALLLLASAVCSLFSWAES